MVTTKYWPLVARGRIPTWSLLRWPPAGRTVQVAGSSAGTSTVTAVGSAFAIGVGASAGTSTAAAVPVTVTKDGPSNNRYMPQNSGNFSSLGITAPSNLYLMQEASGNLADSIGSLTLTASGSPSYQQAVTSWTTKAVKTTEVTSQGFTVASGSGPSPASTSVAFFAYVKLTATPGGTRDVMGVQGANGFKISALGTGKLRLTCVGINADSVNSYNDSNVHPLLLVFNRTGSTIKMYTDSETVTGTYAAGALDNTKGFGALGSTDSPAAYLQGWIASGATAESYTAATLTALGW